MTVRNIKLVNREGLLLANTQVMELADRFEGAVDLEGIPPSVRALFEEFEEIVNGQMFSFLDDIQERIRNLGIKAVLENGTQRGILDLQVYPCQGDVSFRLMDYSSAGAAAMNGKAGQPNSELLPIKDKD